MTNINPKCKINYLRYYNDEKLLPFQFYNRFGLVTIPMIDKRPFIKGWQNTTKTIHPVYISNNIGILSGKINNITVLDIDIKDNGIKHWNKISKEFPKINTPYVKTPTGGLHYYFKYNDRLPSMNRIKVGKEKIGWDIKNDKSVLLAPPSTISDIPNKKYKWIISPLKTEFKDMPIWLEYYILEHLKKK